MKTFFLMAIGCFTMAVIVNFAAKQKYSDAVITRSSTVAITDNLHVGKRLEVTSVCFAALGVVFWVSSVVRKEQCCQSILIVLFVFFILVFFVAV
jgi:hypothetical protein